MKLDPTVLRTMNAQDFRVMEAVEKGMKDHELVPTALISSNANLRHGGAHKIISSLLRDKLLSHERKTKHGCFDGYRLTNAGYDILALHALKTRGLVAAMGPKIGTGKESDIYLAVHPTTGEQVVLKFHRLGRTSFRNVKKKRDYFGGGRRQQQQAHSWLFLSRLSALKEFAFMKALHEVNYPTPTPLGNNRHVVVMGLVRGVPLYQIYPKQLSVEQAADIYEQAVCLASRLARRHGLVHCDLNEFNLMVDLSGIQTLATAADDPYVRHSGQSVMTGKQASLAGDLSKPAWEQSLEAGDRIQEALPEPAARLDNGEPKPVVTLIDFPQMISTKHPNAHELYERDMACLRRFFELKLLCTIPDDAEAGCSWEAVVGSGGTSDETSSTELSQDRLDADLKASGFNDKLSAGLELYYFDSSAQPESAITEEEAESNDDDDDVEGDSDDAEAENNPQEDDATIDEQPVPEQEGKSNANDIEIDNVKDVEKARSDEEGAVVVVDTSSVITATNFDRERMEREAKNRVRRQLEEQKRKSRKSGAFKNTTRNNNKSYAKGKRVLKDAF